MNEPDLFVEFLRDFVPIELLKEVSPDDIEDMTERFLPLFQDNKDSDTVKRIHLKSDVPLFVIAVFEHESQVNFRASFKMLQYIAMVLLDYEKEVNKDKKGKKSKTKITYTKDFKFPPVLPIIFYDGPEQWSAEVNFLDKTEMAGVFAKYIPKFEYELVALNRYDKEDLIRFGDMLSLIMLIDKIRKPEEMSLLSQLPQDYVERLALNIPEHLKKLLADVITVLLTKIHVPKQEIDTVTEKIYERRIQEMFTLLEPYDVQETRRLEREKTEKEMQKIMRAKDKEILEERKKVQVREMEAQAEREKVQAREMEAARKMRQKNMSDEEIAEILNIPIETLRDAH
jgi:hypothetical protein